LKQVEGSKPPSPKKISQIELMKRRTPVQNHTMQGDSEGAGRDPEKRRLFRARINCQPDKPCRVSTVKGVKKEPTGLVARENSPVAPLSGFRLATPIRPARR
jgi:hypothetical protein